MITITDTAVAKLKEISESDGVGHYSVRVRIIGGGCSGFTHDMFFDDQIADVDEVVETNGVKIVVDPLSMQYMEDTVIDYLVGVISSGFKFLNPNVKGSCGCGSSVSF